MRLGRCPTSRRPRPAQPEVGKHILAQDLTRMNSRVAGQYVGAPGFRMVGGEVSTTLARSVSVTSLSSAGSTRNGPCSA
jgi:hypothetical protein